MRTLNLVFKLRNALSTCCHCSCLRNNHRGWMVSRKWTSLMQTLVISTVWVWSLNLMPHLLIRSASVHVPRLSSLVSLLKLSMHSSLSNCLLINISSVLIPFSIKIWTKSYISLLWLIWLMIGLSLNKFWGSTSSAFWLWPQHDEELLFITCP